LTFYFVPVKKFLVQTTYYGIQINKAIQFFSLSFFNQKNSSMLCIGVNKVKIHFDTSQLCCGVVHYLYPDGLSSKPSKKS